MDELIKQLLQGELFWYETTPFNPSAFSPYSNTPINEPGLQSGSRCNNIIGVNSGNLNKRMIEFLKRNWSTTTVAQDVEKQRGVRHMMNERMRRDKQKRSYFALHSMLPPGTKNDQNSIVQTATKRIQELEWLRKDLEDKSYELQATLDSMNQQDQNNERTKINVKIENPTSGIDSMLEVLKCLKKLDSNPIMIRSKFTNQELIAVMDLGTEVRAAEVEKAVNSRWQEATEKAHECWTRC